MSNPVERFWRRALDEDTPPQSVVSDLWQHIMIPVFGTWAGRVGLVLSGEGIDLFTDWNIGALSAFVRLIDAAAFYLENAIR